MTGLYVHIPYCRKRCHYCNFVLTTGNPSRKGDGFLDALEREMRFYASSYETTHFDTLYVGGGTPSVLSAAQTSRLMRGIRRFFKIKAGAEIAWEANPGDVDAEKARLYRDLGINRVSLGAQAFQDRLLRRLNRTHTAADVFESFRILRKQGFRNVNLDLMVSLPGQTLRDAEASARAAGNLAADHVSVYDLTLEEGTAFSGLFKKGRLKLPSDTEQLGMLERTREILENAGFHRYELLNYAKPGRESRHNRLYWANEEYLGLGPGAFSYRKGRRYRYSRTVEDYFEKTARGDWSAAEEETLEPGDRAVESFLLSLRLTEGAPLERFAPVADSLREEISRLRENELVHVGPDRIFLTAKGQFLAETVFTELSSSRS